MWLPPRTINDKYVVRRAPVGRTTEETHQYACFTDLQKNAYDSVDRELPWEVLTRFSVPTMLLTTIRKFLEGMQFLVRTGYSEHSEWFDATWGLRQGRVLSPLLFKGTPRLRHTPCKK